MGMSIDSELYFDALEDSIASTSGSNCDTDEECINSGYIADRLSTELPYNVWIRSPESVEQRREMFWNWLERSASQTTLNNLKVETDRLSTYSEAMVSACSSLRDELYLSWSSMLPCSNTLMAPIHQSSERETNMSEIRSSVDPFESTVNDLNLLSQGGNPKEALVQNWRVARQNQNPLRTCSLKDFEQKTAQKMAHEVVATKGIKSRWLRRLRSMTCTMHNKVKLDAVEIPASKCIPNAPRFHRVKVQHCRKKMKELSALYMGQKLSAHSGLILAMKFSPDGQYLASAGEDKIVLVWQVVEEERSIKLDMPEIDPSCLYFTVNRLSELAPLFVDKERVGKSQVLRKSSDSACVIFPPKVFRILEKPIHEFMGHCGGILDLSWSNDNYLLSASDDSTVRLWRVGHSCCLQVFSHSNFVTCVEFNPVNNSYFMSGCIDGKVRLWGISTCQVVDWIDIKEIVTAISYRPDAQGGIAGSIAGICHSFEISDNQLLPESRICLHNKKKSPCKKITGFQFLPQDQSKVMVACADSQVRIINGPNVIQKYKGPYSTGQKSASLTMEGKHIVAACENTDVYVWNCNGEEWVAGSRANTHRSCEHFPANASIAIPWQGLKLPKVDCEITSCAPDAGLENSLPFSTPAYLCLSHENLLHSFPKGTATWPEESLPASTPLAIKSSSMCKSQYKFLKASCQSTSISHAWGLVIVTAGSDGSIRSFHNYGLPVLT